MALYDARPPFAAIGGTVPPEFAALPTPCYLLDEAALTRNAEILRLCCMGLPGFLMMLLRSVSGVVCAK